VTAAQGQKVQKLTSCFSELDDVNLGARAPYYGKNLKMLKKCTHVYIMLTLTYADTRNYEDVDSYLHEQYKTNHYSVI
jgi:hypothetical protein